MTGAAIAPDNALVPGRTVDFGEAAGDYASHRAGFPPQFFERIAAQFGLRPGMGALDLGTGTGTVARGLAGLGLDVQAIDPSDALMAQACVRDAQAGVTIDYHVGRAEALPFRDGVFDLVTAGQCWHWFDRPVAAREAARVLKPGGVLVIGHFDWLPFPGNLVEATETLILAHNPLWAGGGGCGVHPAWLADMSGAGFTGIESASFDHDQPYTSMGWRGRIRASAGVGGSLDAAATQRFDAALAAMLAERFGDDPAAVLFIPHRVWWAAARTSG
jgi:SAM-dependent methyltransferase